MSDGQAAAMNGRKAMSTTAIQALVKLNDFTNVMQVYSGKTGCMCGCQGRYHVASQHLALADADRGYGHDQEDVSDRSVKIIVNKMIKQLSTDPGAVMHLESKDQYVAYDLKGRTYAAYFADWAADQTKSEEESNIDAFIERVSA